MEIDILFRKNYLGMGFTRPTDPLKLIMNISSQASKTAHSFGVAVYYVYYDTLRWSCTYEHEITITVRPSCTYVPRRKAFMPPSLAGPWHRCSQCAPSSAKNKNVS